MLLNRGLERSRASPDGKQPSSLQLEEQLRSVSWHDGSLAGDYAVPTRLLNWLQRDRRFTRKHLCK